MQVLYSGRKKASLFMISTLLIVSLLQFWGLVKSLTCYLDVRLTRTEIDEWILRMKYLWPALY
jgi:hypothetical protein